MASDKTHLSETSGSSDVEAFLKKVAAIPKRSSGGTRGRLIVALDATASREPTWDRACRIQGEMFEQTANLGGIDIQLVFYRGFNHFYHSDWISDARSLHVEMDRVRCSGGQTQIERVLAQGLTEARKHKVNALVFVGDCMEEDVDRLCHQAGQLGLLGVPVFVFHEGHDVIATDAFRQIARLSGGVYCRFNAASAQQLKDLLSAVAVFATGGHKALKDLGDAKGGIVRRLTQGMNTR